MDPVIWIEILSRQQDVVARHRFSGADIRIGRAYDNDVVVDDPYVAPHHLRLVRGDGGGLVAENMGSANGLFRDGDAARQERLAIDGDSVYRIGATRFRVRDALYAVAPEKIARAPVRVWPQALALAAALLGLEMLTLWLRETGEPTLSRYAVPALAMVAFVTAWTTMWAVLSRVFSGRARFERHLLVALGGLVVFSFYVQVMEYAAFAFSLPALPRYQFFGMWLMVAATCYFHLRAIGPGRLLLKGGGVAAICAVAIATQILMQREERTNVDQQNFVRRLEPPGLRLVAPTTETAFFASAARLKGGLDKARTEEPSADIGSAASDDD